ncbi:MAG: peptidoglycan DD-metalloendopeptidase family protein [Pseudomonadota bacterium]|nr:peptidoglycan DD-metalloendopeptidase family protein [Pseudomonadota bacterium]
MAKSKQQLAAMLAALQRLARMPTATLIAVPQTQDETIRSGILLRAIIPNLQQAAHELAGDLRALASLQVEIYEKKKRLSETLRSMKIERRKLASLTVKKLFIFNTIRKQKSGAARRAALLSAKANTLRELLENLAAHKDTTSLVNTDFHPTPDPGGLDQKTPVIDPLTNIKPALPVLGSIVLAFGDRQANGKRSRGVAIETRAGALVVAPLAGKVVFAGTFRGYRNLVILELSNRRHALISGMSEITAELGDEVMVGEPLGAMPSATAAAPQLYYEIRNRGRPIDPVLQTTKPTNKARS